MFTIITLPPNFVASTTATMADLVSDLSPYITLIIGVLLAVVVIEILLGILRK
jgi:type II secretory pathway component PulF